MPLSAGDIISIPASPCQPVSIARRHKSLCDVEMPLLICYHCSTIADRYRSRGYDLLQCFIGRLKHVQKRSDCKRVRGVAGSEKEVIVLIQCGCVVAHAGERTV